MQAIVTKYLGPTDSRGSRIKATAANGESVTVPYGFSGDEYSRHERAAKALMQKLEWDGEIIGGSLRDGYAWVFAPERSRDPAPRRSTAVRRAARSTRRR